MEKSFVIGSKIQKLATLKGLSQSRLATLVGYESSVAINQIVSGKRLPSPEKLFMIAKILDVPVGVLSDDNDYTVDELEAFQKLTNLIKNKDKSPDEYEHALFFLKKLAN